MKALLSCIKAQQRANEAALSTTERSSQERGGFFFLRELFFSYIYSALKALLSAGMACVMQ
jgi:hypothetical protein